MYKHFVDTFGVITIEDPYEQDDWANWSEIVGKLGAACQIVGDDHLVTNPKRIKKAIEEKSSNALLLKVRVCVVCVLGGGLVSAAARQRRRRERGWCRVRGLIQP